MARTKTRDLKRSIPMAVWIVSLFVMAAAIASPAQSFKTLYNFCGGLGEDCSDGVYFATLVQGTDGNFYGTAYSGDASHVGGQGMVFSVTPGGALTPLYSFCSQTGCTDGSNPTYGLVLGNDGNFYGTTSNGGLSSGTCAQGFGAGCGTIFKITPQGVLTTLHTFDFTDGAYPYDALIQGTDGNFYGTTFGGGNACSSIYSPYGCGTVFRMTPEGKLTTLHSFDGTDGQGLYGGLVQATDGNFYGTTYSGGTNATCNTYCGTLFKITAKGVLTTLHTFNGADGSNPFGPLLQAADGNFYGTTISGGAQSYNRGTVFRVTAKGAITTLHSFCSSANCSDGYWPQAGLIQATDGNFYGTAEVGGFNGSGTVFQITPSGALIALHSFAHTEGQYPFAGVLQATSGKFYGSTSQGGKSDCGGFGCGTIFGVSVGLVPFVKTEPTSGKVGTSVVILGSNLTGSTAVSFNGAAASFTVVSGNEITATVPIGATTGTVVVTTPKKTLKSNVAFRVTP
jgi:uncharacterized repeat protein (TIGR03803 family)